MTAFESRRRFRSRLEPALGFVVGAAFFTLVALVLAAVDSEFAVIVFGAVCVAAVIAIASAWGVAFAVPAAMVGYLAYDWFEFPPTHPAEFPDRGDLADLLVYLATSVLIGELASHAARRAEVSEAARGALADEQGALRRVATLVARECPPAEVFSAVAAEVGALLGIEGARIWRYENERTATAVAAWGEFHAAGGLAAAITLPEDSIAGRVRRTHRPARVDDYQRTGTSAAGARAAGIRAAVGTPIVVDGRLWGAMVVATTRDAPLPPDTEKRVRQFTELVATAISNVQARSDLAASRARLVAAADDERRRVVRDLHDGAQQRLVHTVITLKLARHALGEDDHDSSALVNEALDQAQQAMAELRELAHGILPSALTHGGLRAGIGELASRMPVPVEIDVPVDRLARPVEATAYFVVAEALTNVAKHSSAGRAEVAARVEEGTLRVDVRDDGHGGARADGSGLLGLADRLAVLHGRLEVDSPPGGGTRVAAAIPLPPGAGR